jgi:electron transport complex protein RnfG
MIEMIKMIAALAIISALAGLAIGAANEKTRDKIAEQEKLAERAAIEAVFPQGAAIREEKGGGLLPDRYWSASLGGATGYAFEVSGRGYSDDIKFMIGVDNSGKILGMSVLSHSETPGLGERVNEVASTEYVWYPLGGGEPAKPWFTQQFEGLVALKPIGINKSVGEWHSLDERKREELRGKNEVTAITGSTISTRAFTSGILKTVGAYVDALNKDNNEDNNKDNNNNKEE